jgi:hypothetical protein
MSKTFIYNGNNEKAKENHPIGQDKKNKIQIILQRKSRGRVEELYFFYEFFRDQDMSKKKGVWKIRGADWRVTDIQQKDTLVICHFMPSTHFMPSNDLLIDTFST